MLKRVLILFLFISFHILSAQNLVPNPSFEDFSRCPANIINSLSAATPWYSPTAGTPDYWHTCAGTVPTNTFGSQNPRTGDGYIGMHLHQEMAQVQLTQPLIAGRDYCVSFYVSRADRGRFATMDIGINLSNTAITGAPVFPKPTLSYSISSPPGDTILDTANWVLVSGIYTALGGEEYLTLGNFIEPTVRVDVGGFILGPYYFFDDVSVIEWVSTNRVVDTTLCENDTLFLDATIPDATYLWQDSSTNATFNVTQSGTYWVEITSICGIIMDTFNVVEITVPTVNANATATTICFGDPVTLSGSGTATDYSWNNNILDNIPFNPDSSATYIVTGTNGGNCQTTDSITVIVNPLPTIDAGENTTILLGNDITLTATGTDGTHTWSPETWLSCILCTSTTSTPQNTITYTVTVTDANTCSSSDSVTITVNEEVNVFIPNAFTPNNDNLNDVFLPISSNLTTENFSFKIFNRWGEVIFESNNSSEGWNGSYKNEPVPNGAYTWKMEFVDFNGEIKRKNGLVKVVR